eukprot:CAMPEP_0206140318 /NCGR_PEP_ID=MMETSP1473-20131121/9086_1 /ASSEMBLY_ACC=CAM_ASM_001109 /TAXON_ID=1461547 /ORGANISM="Stichococcus sp, Strain RCC1054" /LENGTH=296 /DNA_ID=CAMNT_0053534437 /DNA_START=149 /DNA_END=1039 /DNA_ORIENTATION=+
MWQSMAPLAFHDPDLERGFIRYHAQKYCRLDISFCIVGSLIWVATLLKMPPDTSWGQKVLCILAGLTPLAPALMGSARWGTVREPCVFCFRILRTLGVLLLHFDPGRGSTVPMPTPFRILLTSKTLQLAGLATLFPLRLGNHLLVQMGALAMAWHINLRTCVGWGAALLHQQQGGPPADGAAASPLTALYSQAPIFVDAVKACNRLTGASFKPENGCPLTLGTLQLLGGVVVPTLYQWHSERRMRREYAMLAGQPPEAPGAGALRRNGQLALMAGAIAVFGASLCWQLLEAYERTL